MVEYEIEAVLWKKKKKKIVKTLVVTESEGLS